MGSDPVELHIFYSVSARRILFLKTNSRLTLIFIKSLGIGWMVDMCGGFYLYRTWAYPRHIREETSLSSLDRNAHPLWGGIGILGKRLTLPPPDASVGATNLWSQCSSPSFEFPGSSSSSLSRSPVRSGEHQRKTSCSFLNLTNSHSTRLCCSSLFPFFCPIAFWDNLIQFWNPKVSRTILAVSESFSHPQPHTQSLLSRNLIFSVH